MPCDDLHDTIHPDEVVVALSYEFPVDSTELFGERKPQFVGEGLPGDDLDEAASRVRRMWADEPGGWLFEFASLAERYARRGDHAKAQLAYGIAHFPVLASTSARKALALQKSEYIAAAHHLDLHFSNWTQQVPYRDGTAGVPVHLLSPTADLSGTPVLIASGGLDSWKMDLHRILEAFVRDSGVAVLAFDHPGTGETVDVALDRHADDVVVGMVDVARTLGDGRVYHFGLSFGGNFASMTGLRGLVDGAINVGGPTAKYFDDFEHLQFGMRDIFSNTLGFASRPSPSEISSAAAPFDRRSLFDHDDNAPMLVVNGADDVHVPQDDTLLFEGRRATEVHLIAGAGHCAMSKMSEILPMMTRWLRDMAGPARS